MSRDFLAPAIAEVALVAFLLDRMTGMGLLSGLQDDAMREQHIDTKKG